MACVHRNVMLLFVALALACPATWLSQTGAAQELEATPVLAADYRDIAPSEDASTVPQLELEESPESIPVSQQPVATAVPAGTAPVETGAAAGGKVFLLGLDGATFRILLPMFDAGLLPNLKRCFEAGKYGVLFSQANYSPVSWNSIFTGLGRLEHGVSGLYLPAPDGCRFAPDVKETEELHLASFDRRAEPIWRTLSDAGKRCGVIGFLTTYPADEVNGLFISGDMSPNLLTRDTESVILRVDSTAPSSGLSVFRGTVFGTEVVVSEYRAGQYRLTYADEPNSVYGELTKTGQSWIQLRLDGALDRFLATGTDVYPSIRVAGWDRAPLTPPPALQITIPSGISPRHHYKHRNRPLIVYIDSTEPGEPYDRVRFSYRRDLQDLSDSADIYGIKVTGIIQKTGLKPEEAGEVWLMPHIPGGVPLRLVWSADSTRDRDVSIGTGDNLAVREGAWSAFIRWAVKSRRMKFDSPSAFLGLSYAKLSFTAQNATLNLGPVYDSFTRPAYDFIWPRNLLADLDITTLPTDTSLELYRNHRIKKYLFDQVFDPQQFDFFGLCFTETDSMQHYPWNSPDPQDLDISRQNNVSINTWQQMDQVVGDILERLGPEWTVVVCSDHGFHSVFNRREIAFHWNKVLSELKLVEIELPPANVMPPSYPTPRPQAYRLELTYRCTAPIDREARGTLVLVDSDGRTVANQRWHPGNGAFCPQRWKQGQVIRTAQDVAFNEDVPAGTYTLRLNVSPSSGQPVDLGTIDLPESAPSLIQAEGLMRIGDVELLTEQAIAALPPTGQVPVTLRPGIDLIQWSITPVPSRYLSYLSSSKLRPIKDKSSAVYYRGYSESGQRLPKDGIYLVHQANHNQSALLDELVALVRSVRIVGTNAPLFRNVRSDTRLQAVLWDVDQETFGPEMRVNGIVFRTYDASQQVTYNFRGTAYTRPLSEVVFSPCSSFHENEGVYAVSGAAQPQVGRAEQAAEWDVAATVLSLMGVTPATQLRGTSFVGIGAIGSEPTEEVVANDELYEQLKSIGYMDNL